MKLLLLLAVLAADPTPVRVIHVEARKATPLQQADGIGLIVEAVGLVGAPGWTATLVPRNDGDHAEDGYLEFDLQGVPPTNAVGIVEVIEASIPAKLDPTRLRGVRVYGGGQVAEHKLYFREKQ